MRSLHSTLVLVLLAAISGACTYGHQDSQSNQFRPLVFPGEARLGASAFMVIDANDIALGDELERYDLHRDRVRILVEGNLDTVPVTLRSVFSVESGRATNDAELRPNGWMTVAFFDLPDASQGAFSAPYPLHAPLHLEIDDNVVPELEGVIWIVGEGGTPTSMNAMPLLPFLEDELEPRTMVRLRGKGQDSVGFHPSWAIGGIHAEIHYDPACLENPRAYLGSEAVGGGVIIGPSSAAPAPFPAGLQAAQLVVSHPKGFQLASATDLDPSRLGTGPILDIAFERLPDMNCSSTLDQYFWIRSLNIREIGGTQRASRPFPSEGTSFDAAEFFHFHYVDPDPPS